MSYIRTKDGIYELKENGIGQTPKEVQIALMTNDYKQADTIWELCDGFYIDVNVFEKSCVYEKDEYYDFHYMITQCLNKNNIKYTAYGFIKTSKGLIYVAKLNENGKLVLI